MKGRSVNAQIERTDPTESRATAPSSPGDAQGVLGNALRERGMRRDGRAMRHSVDFGRLRSPRKSTSASNQAHFSTSLRGSSAASTVRPLPRRVSLTEKQKYEANQRDYTSNRVVHRPNKRVRTRSERESPLASPRSRLPSERRTLRKASAIPNRARSAAPERGGVGAAVRQLQPPEEPALPWCAGLASPTHWPQKNDPGSQYRAVALEQSPGSEGGCLASKRAMTLALAPSCEGPRQAPGTR